METRIGATQAARTFSDLISRVRYRGEEFVIERGGQPVCRVVPVRPVGRTVTDLVRLLRSTPGPDPRYWDAVEEIIQHQPALPRSPWRR